MVILTCDTLHRLRDLAEALGQASMLKNLNPTDQCG
jgi:hypothetical protein